MTVTTTDIRYRKVSAESIGRIRCIGDRVTDPQCYETATWCRQWQTSAMASPAFWYACDAHAAKMAADDGLSLEPYCNHDAAAVVNGVCECGETVNPYAVGSVWHTSWGYDQTNVEYYEVVRETAASVWLVPMGASVRDGRLYPTTTTGLATPELHRKPRDAYGIEHPYLTLDSVRSAWPYTRGGQYDTRAAGQAGH